MGVLKVNVGTPSVPVWRKVGCGGSAATVYFSDAFNRADDATTLGSPWFTAPLFNSSGVVRFGISSNQAYLASNTSASDGVAYVDPSSSGSHSDVTVQATMTYVTGSGQQVGLAVRYTSSSGRAVIAYRTGLFNAYNSTWLATWSALPSGTVLTVTASGTMLTVTADGTQIAQVTDNSHTTTATRHGIVGNLSDGSWRVDDFSISSPVTRGRLKLWTGSGWVREKCDNETTTVTLTDDFNRADNATTLNPPSDGGSSWLVQSGTGGGTPLYGISSNHAVRTSGTADPKATREVGAYLSMTYSCKVQRSNGTVLLFFAYTDNINYYSVTVDTSGPMTLTKMVNGTPTTLATASLGFWFGEVHTVTITHDQTTGAITVAWDGVTKISTTNTAVTGTRCGFQLPSSGGYADDFSVSAVIPTPGHPLKLWDGTTWQTVACMVPA